MVYVTKEIVERGDSVHKVITDVKVLHGGELHRFVNAGGEPYSSIYRNGLEIFSHEREKESDMVAYWNERMGY